MRLTLAAFAFLTLLNVDVSYSAPSTDGSLPGIKIDSIGIGKDAQAADTPRASSGNVISGGQVFTWTGLDGDDTGIPVNVAKCKTLTAHIYSSTYGSSTVTLQGSNDPIAGTSSYASAEWAGLADNSGTAISKTADAIERIEEKPIYFRPVTASGTSANIAVGLHCQY